MRLVERGLQLALLGAQGGDEVGLLLLFALGLLYRDLRARQLSGERLLLVGELLQRRRVPVEFPPRLHSNCVQYFQAVDE